MSKNYPAPPVTAVMPTDLLRIRLGRILEKGLEFHEFIWFGDQQKVKRYLKRHPEVVRAKMQSFAKFFDRAVPVKVLHQSEGGKRFDVEELRKMNPKMSDIKKLAGIEDRDEEQPEDLTQQWDYETNPAHVEDDEVEEVEFEIKGEMEETEDEDVV